MSTISATSVIEFDIPAIPVAQPRQRTAVIAGHVRNFTPSRHPVQAFKATCRMIAAERYAGPVLDGPLRIHVAFVLPRPSNRMWKRREMPREPHDKRPDMDNLLKSVTDALTGLLWRDDSQLASVLATKEIAAGGEPPHVRIAVERIGAMPEEASGVRMFEEAAGSFRGTDLPKSPAPTDELNTLRRYFKVMEERTGSECDNVERCLEHFNGSGELKGDGKWRLQEIFGCLKALNSTLEATGEELGKIDVSDLKRNPARREA